MGGSQPLDGERIMDFFSSDRSDKLFTTKVLSRFSDLKSSTQVHLQRVYATLAACVLISALGCWTYVNYHIGGAWSGFVALGLLIWLNFTDSHEKQKRLGILG